MAVDNKYITVAYKLYTIEDGEEDEEPVEVANQRHPFQFISGFNLVLPAFEANIAPLERGDEFDFVIPFKDAYGEFNEELMFDVPESVFMVDGKIRALGTPDELKQNYHQPDINHVFTYLARQASRSSD